MTTFEQVKEFHEAFRQPVGEGPQWLSEERMELRWDLIHEEYLEVAQAIDNHDLVNLALECADLVYVVNGLMVECGIDLDEVISRVHQSNMSKLDDNGNPTYRLDGKILKGQNYLPPDVSDII